MQRNNEGYQSRSISRVGGYDPAPSRLGSKLVNEDAAGNNLSSILRGSNSRMMLGFNSEDTL